ncbi:hypothetical protein EDB80DRAFT_647492 [Ilyonectria destructans]|nr:hypothetical protein EDB80DRAFT_647492 [Ilyonectria destructans]
MKEPWRASPGRQGQEAIGRSVDAQTSPSTGGFKFVNLSHPESLYTDEGIRTEIRRHVMKDIGQQRRRRRPKAKSSKATRASVQPPCEEPPSTQSENSNVMLPSRSLVPLGSLPIEANARVRELLHFSNASADIHQPLRKVWFEVALTDPGALHVTLGNTATFLVKLRGDNNPMKNPEILGHYSRSVMLLRRRLASATESVREGTIANILAHVCLTIRYSDWNSWSVHMDGLRLISNLRGGFADLRHPIPTLILLYDITGSMVFDSFPRFPLPPDIPARRTRSIRDVPHRLRALLVQIEQMPPYISVVGDALQILSSIADVVNRGSHSALFWEKDIDAIILLGPCIHFLLSMPRLPDGFGTLPQASDLIMREILRLVGLLIISRLKTMFGLPASEQATLQAKLSDLVAQHAISLEERHLELEIWALVTAALLQNRGERGVYVQEIQRVASGMVNQSSREVIELAEEMIWINILESPNVESLLQELGLFSLGDGEL